MTGVEITLILVGIIFVLGSFFVQEKLTPKDVQEITRLSEKELKIIVERELKNANDKVEDAIKSLKYSIYLNPDHSRARLLLAKLKG